MAAEAEDQRLAEEREAAERNAAEAKRVANAAEAKRVANAAAAKRVANAAEAKRVANAAEAKKVANAAEAARITAAQAVADAEAEAEAARIAAAQATVETEAQGRVRVQARKIEISRLKEEIAQYAYVASIKDNEKLKQAYITLTGLPSPTQADLTAFKEMLDAYIKSSNDIKKTALFFINVYTSDTYGKMLGQTEKIQTKPRVDVASGINAISTIADSIRTQEQIGKSGGKTENITKIIEYLDSESIIEGINADIAKFKNDKTRIFLVKIKDILNDIIRNLILDLKTNLINHTSGSAYRKKYSIAQSGGFRESTKSSKASHLCDLMLTSILLKLDGPEFNYQALIDKAGKTLDDIGQCDLILEMLNHLIDEHCLIKKTDGYNFSSVYIDIPQARALVEAFNKNFNDKEKQKFFEISGGVFNYKIPDEHQTLLGKHPFFLVGTPREADQETPLYGVIDDEIMLTMEERSVLEEDGIPIGAILFLYIVCFRKNEGHDPLGLCSSTK